MSLPGKHLLKNLNFLYTMCMKTSLFLERSAHPLPLAAAALVLVNDLLFRPLWPAAWWTGKLSTLAAAFALPVLLAAFLSILFPRRPKAAGAAAFALVLVTLLLLKLTPETNRWLTGWLPIRAIPDPSDLLAILPWSAALWFYFRPVSHPARPLGWPRLLLVPLAAVFLLADAAAPDYGVAGIIASKDGSLSTRAGYVIYRSSDGGESWNPSEMPLPEEFAYGPALQEPLELTAPGGVRYRVTPGQGVERSAADGSWQPVFASAPLSEPEQVFLDRTITANLDYLPGPLDAQLAPGGENLVVAMGVEGVLIVPPQGEPRWIAVGPYRRRSLENAGLDGYLTVLSGEIWLAVCASLLWLATAALRLRRSTWQMILVVLGWLLFLVVGAAQHPEINTGYLAAFASLGILVLGVWSVILVLIALFRLRGRPLHPFTRRLLFIPVFMLVFLLPFVAWALSLLPFYWIAQLAAGGLTVAMVGLMN